MRTLASQMRLRRLVRVHAEYMDRLAAAPSDGELARLARARLAQLTDDLRRAWLADLAGAGMDVSVVDRHMQRSLRAIESLTAELARPAADREWLAARFRDTALPLVFFLRGLEGAPAELADDGQAPRRLPRSA